MLSLIVPTLNAEATLGRTLQNLRAGVGDIATELVVVDGGSRDLTLAVAERHGARIVGAQPGRGGQLRAGAAAARGDVLLFLHADTALGQGWAEAVRGFLADPASRERAAYFRFALDDADPRARRIERGVAWRCRRLGLPYGDQGLLIRRAFYDALGGFADLPLMEDVELIRRIGKRRLTALDVPAVTSAARYRRDGWLARPLRNTLCLAGYFLGVPPKILRRLYG